VECKNFVGDLNNKELDQLGGRFSPSRGKVGLLLCRRFKDKPLFVQRYRDTAKDDRGFIIVIDDSDLKELVELVRAGKQYETFQWFQRRFDELIN
jgi:hypothetical protein